VQKTKACFHYRVGEGNVGVDTPLFGAEEDATFPGSTACTGETIPFISSRFSSQCNLPQGSRIFVSLFMLIRSFSPSPTAFFVQKPKISTTSLISRSSIMMFDCIDLSHMQCVFLINSIHIRSKYVKSRIGFWESFLLILFTTHSPQASICTIHRRISGDPIP
jgi:hypothetical protein